MSRPLRPMRSKLPPPASTRSRGFPSMESTYPAETRVGFAIGPPLPSSRGVTVDVDHGLSECLRIFLRHVVADAIEDAVRVFSGELVSITRSALGRTVEIARDCDRGHRDDRTLPKACFQVFVLRFTLNEVYPPAVIGDHNGDVIRVIEGRSGSIESCIAKMPVRGNDGPDELCKVVPVLRIAEHAVFRSKVILVPPSQLGLWRQRLYGQFPIGN